MQVGGPCRDRARREVSSRPPTGTCCCCTIPGFAPKERNVPAASPGTAGGGVHRQEPLPLPTKGGSGPWDTGLWEDFLYQTLGAGHTPCTLRPHRACSGQVVPPSLCHGPQCPVTSVWSSRQLVACYRSPSCVQGCCVTPGQLLALSESFF